MRSMVWDRRSLTNAAFGAGLLGVIGALVAGPGARAARAEGKAPPALHVVAGDGTAGFHDGRAARFNKPIRLAPCGKEGVVVADIYNHAIRLVSLDGVVRTLAGAPDRKGYEDGPAETARFASPHGVAVSPAGVIAVAEAENHTIRLMTPAKGGSYTVSTLAGAAGEAGMKDGPAAEARFRSPHAVAWTKDGDLLVADIGNARIRLVRDGRVTTVAGAEPGTFTYPMDVALRPDGVLLIADAGTDLIRRWVPGSAVDTVTLKGALHTPHGIAVSPDGTVYVADMKAHQVMAIGADGSLTRVCGTGTAGSAPNELNRPAAVLVHSGRLWVADLDNHRISAVALR